MKTKIGLLGLIMSFLFISCNNDTGNQGATTMTADDLTVNANLDEMSDDVSKIADIQLVVQSGTTGRTGDTPDNFLPTCVTINSSLNGSTWSSTIDFGTEGCTMPNGNVLKGKIILSGETVFNTPAYTLNCSFENFYHNGNLVQGSKTIVRTFESTPNLESIHPVLTINTNITVTTLNGVVRTLTGTRVREKIEGIDTPMNWKDDVFIITGNQTVVSPKGTMTSTITTPLRIEMNCNHIVQGIIEHVKDTKTATLDYGDGTCDNKATVTINGQTKEIILGKKI